MDIIFYILIDNKIKNYFNKGNFHFYSLQNNSLTFNIQKYKTRYIVKIKLVLGPISS